MYRVIACLQYEHDSALVIVAALVCVLGSCLSVLLTRRMMRAARRRKHLQLGLASLMAGATIWSTHFIAMLAYEPGFAHAYEPIMTAVSLAVAAAGMLLANAVLAYDTDDRRYIAAGMIFGITISVMHFVGMSAYQLPGEIVWHIKPTVASVALGIAFGVVTFHRVAKPSTRFCWIGAAACMVLTICTMHFTAMSAFHIQLNPLETVPPKMISDVTLGLFITVVMALIMLISFASVSIELNLENETRAQLQYAAHHDPLTGLPNRLGLKKHISDVTPIFESDQTHHLAILTIDLDLFKEINDMHGHLMGDKVLQEVSRRLGLCINESEFVARTGGDEFIAIKTDLRRLAEVLAFAERLRCTILETVVIDDVSVSVGASIGVATSFEDGRSIPDLQQKSDLAMYRAKRDSDRRISVYNEEIDRQGQERRLLIQDLRNAQERGEFELAFQLQNDLTSLDPVGFEVLLRWNHPVHGRIPPDQFIPLAEETGLILDIGLWVLRAASEEAVNWPADYGIAVNVAPQQLVQASFAAHVAEILRETGLPADRLELEVTEASIIDDQIHTLKVMSTLKEMGIRIAMDDFGTGYSSLATLQAFPFDKIKIDRSFIQDVNTNEQRAAIVRATLLLGAALKIPVLAEGVETEAELTFLRDEKCASVQGFYFGKPMSMWDVHKIIAARLKKSA